MRFWFSIPLVSVFILPAPARAASEAKDCPSEPTQNVRMVSGNVFYGSNCAIQPAADLDSFQIAAKAGDIYNIVAALNGGNNNICMDLYDPGQVKFFTGCSNVAIGQRSVVTNQTAGSAGLYTAVVYAAGNNTTLQYGLSLERLSPAPPDGRALTLGQPVADEINPAADGDAFTFAGSTAGTYRVTASIPPANPANLCFTVYRPNGASAGSQCTNSAIGVNSIQLDLTPLENGTHLVLLGASGWDSTISYNLNVTCIICPPPTPSCTLQDVLSYDAASGTLTMDFTVGNTYAATWNAWLTYQNTMELLFSAAQPVTDPPVSVVKTRPNLPKNGKVGVLSTLTTPKRGIACASWVQINTGTP